MDARLAADLTMLPGLLDETRDYAGTLLAGLGDRAAAAPARPFAPAPLPVEGRGLSGALAEFARRWEPGFSGSAGPRYFGFVTGGATPAAVAGDWLTAALDQNAVSSDGSSATDLERETVGWLAALLGLDGHTGSFVTGATMSNVVGLALARQWLGHERGVSAADSGVAAMAPVTVLSATPHASVRKGLSLLGLGRDALRVVPTLPGREAVDVAALDARLAESGPAVVVANAGTVNTVDYDDLRAIAALRERHRFWLHVDGAFGALAALSPAHAHLLDGLAGADSVCVDLHKWLNVPYDSAVQFSRHRDLQVEVFQASAAYLGDVGDDPDFIHLTPESSRRLRALATWFSLTAYGAAGHRDIVERNIATARRLGDRLAALPGLRLLAPVRLNVVCFTVDSDVAEFLRRVTATGEAFLTPTVYGGTPGVRLAVSNWRTEKTDEDRTVAALAEVLAGLVRP